MPRFTFKGFSIGSPVAMSAAQNGQTASDSVAAWGSGTGSIAIDVSVPGTLVARSGVVFEATAISGLAAQSLPSADYDPAYHEITYLWDFGDPGVSFDRPESFPDAWRDANTAWGPQVAHVYATPGAYTVTLFVIDANGTTAQAQTTLTVLDPDDVYAGTQTVCVSTLSDFTDAPTGAAQFTDIASAIAFLDGKGPSRFLFRAGETFTDVNFKLRSAGIKCEYWGRFGPGADADPILRPRRDHLNFSATEDGYIFYMRNANQPQEVYDRLDMRGWWESDVEKGLAYPIWRWNLDSKASHRTLAGCSFNGFSSIAIDDGQSYAGTTVVSDCDVTNWKDYGFFCENQELGTRAFLGNRVVQSANALGGGDKSISGVSTFHNSHGPIRDTGSKRFIMQGNDLFSRCGWSGLASIAPSQVADNPALRTNTSSLLGCRYNLDRNVLEGGYRNWLHQDQNGADDSTPTNTVADRMLCLASPKTLDPIEVEHGSFTLRNALIYMSDAQRAHNPASGAIVLDRHSVDNGNEAAPISVYSTTALSLQNGSDFPLFDEVSAPSFDAVLDENNIVHAPNLTTPVTGQGPLDLTADVTGVALRYAGLRYNFEMVTGTLAANVADGQSFTVAYANITDLLARENGSGTPTDEAYWTVTRDQNDTRHQLRIDGFGYLEAEQGHFSVAFGATAVTITNNTGATWTSGTEWGLQLDRASLLPTIDTIYSTIGQAVPLPMPVEGSPALSGSATGRKARSDAFGVIRTPPFSKGAFEPT